MMPSVERATVVMHGVTRNVEDALARLRAVADEASVELFRDGEGDEEREAEERPDIAVALGGDGTMLRALTRFLGGEVPVIGVNFGRVGFLAAIPAAELERGLLRVFAGEYQVLSLPTL